MINLNVNGSMGKLLQVERRLPSSWWVIHLILLAVLHLFLVVEIHKERLFGLRQSSLRRGGDGIVRWLILNVHHYWLYIAHLLWIDILHRILEGHSIVFWGLLGIIESFDLGGRGGRHHIHLFLQMILVIHWHCKLLILERNGGKWWLWIWIRVLILEVCILAELHLGLL